MATVDPSEVDRLADELWNDGIQVFASEGSAELQEYSGLTMDQIIAGFHAAAAVGARTALEDAANAAYRSKAIFGGGLMRVTVMNWLRARAATYTPEQEGDN